jgi:diguanylate cyclase (GGDEF)-like protein
LYLTVTYFVLLVEVAFSTLCLLLIAPKNQTRSGLRSLVTGFLLVLVALLFVLSGRVHPGFLSYVMGNVLLQLGLAFVHFSFPEVARHMRSQRWLSAALATILFCTCLCFTYVHPSHAWRVLFVSLTIAVQSAATAVLLFRCAEPEVRYPARCTAGIFALTSAIQASRFVWILVNHVAPDEVERSAMRWAVLLSYAALAATVPLLYFWTTTVRLQARLELLASTDSLTGVLNRRGIEHEGAIELARIARTAGRATCCVIAVDLDRFKDLNDLYGHLAGDCVLQALSRSLPPLLRSFDRIGRTGGEEFVILLPETKLEEALIVANRVRESIAAQETLFDEHTLSVTASFGVTALQSRNDGWTDLIRRADENLYKAKRQGRNCIVADEVFVA